MDGYTLSDNEIEIMRAEGVLLLEHRKRRHLKGLLLTNLNLILTTYKRRGLFSRDIYFKRCPLAQIRDVNKGHPQVLINKANGKYCLNVLFEDEAVTLLFPNDTKRLCTAWAHGIERAAVGDLKGALAAYSPLLGIGSAIGKARDALSTALGIMQSNGDCCNGPLTVTPNPTDEPAHPEHPTLVTIKCSNCHAPISGEKGSLVVCEYCGTAQTL